MWCLTAEESRKLAAGTGFQLTSPSTVALDGARHFVSVPLSILTYSRLFWLSNFFASSLEPFDKCLLWVTQWDVWPSNENLHLFYRLRESYGERRLLSDAPGHLFLKHEGPDLATFIELAILSGWDCYLLPNLKYASAFLSHDGFLDFFTDTLETAEQMQKAVEGATLRSKPGSS
jgi:hypothetical protein